MKKYIFVNIALTLTTAAILTSCSNGYLDLQPALAQTQTMTMSTYAGLNSAVSGAYAPLSDATWYGSDWILYNEMKTANGKKYVGTSHDSGRMNEYYNINYTEDLTSHLWGTAYKVIAEANNVIDNLDSSKGEEQNINNLKAECLFLRALAHFDLVLTYAQPYCYTADASHVGVPIILHTDPDDASSRSTVKQVYDQVISDLTTAESIIADDYVRTAFSDAKSSVTKAAVQALLSRVYLYSQQWQKAADEATKVIQNSNYTMWTAADMAGASCFNQDTPQGGEIIFEVYSKHSNDYDPYYEGLPYMTDPNGYADAGAATDVKNLYEKSDVRGTLYRTDDTGFGLWTTKYKGKGTNSPDISNTVVLRLSEMYLNRAEATINGAKGYDAAADMAVIASNRGATAQPATIAGVYSEEEKEFAWEAHLWFDLGRTKRDMTRVDFDGNAAAQNVKWGSTKWAMPIPSREFDVNPNLVQNEGY